MNIRLTSKASAGKQIFCPAEAFFMETEQEIIVLSAREW